MNYRHAYHAGNFADVFKHIVLTRLVEYLKRKDKAFRVYDTHAGIGLYDLGSVEAEKTGEWRDGIAKLAGRSFSSEFLSIAGPYLDIIKALNPGFEQGEITRYPGSPYLVRQLLRKQDRLSAYELHPQDFKVLRKSFEDDYQMRITELDGWLVPGSHVPPKEKRGLVFVDPPFEDGQDFDRALSMMKALHKRWREGMVCFWFPVKHHGAVENFLEQLSVADIGETVLLRLDTNQPHHQNNADNELRFTGSGMVIKNPPFLLEQEIRVIEEELCHALGSLSIEISGISPMLAKSPSSTQGKR